MSDSEKPKSSWRERRETIKHKWAVPFVYFEWKCEQLSELLKRWAFLDILGHVGRLAILVALISYIMGGESRQKAKHYQAWQVISLAQGKSGSGGRKDALEDLNKDGISLAGVDISKAHLLGLNLENADLRDANLAGATLPNANLSGANLWETNLDGAILPNANLAGATLVVANFTGANLSNANLAGANLAVAILVEADLSHANLVGAELGGAILPNANLTNIKGWLQIKNIELANIYDVKNPPDGFIKWALEKGAVRIEDEKEWLKIVHEIRQGQTKEKQ